MTVGELFVVDAEQVQDNGLEVVSVDGVLDDVVAEVVGGSVGVAALHRSCLRAILSVRADFWGRPQLPTLSCALNLKVWEYHPYWRDFRGF